MGWFVGKDPGRKQLNRQFTYYGLVLFMLWLMSLLLKRSYGAP